MADIPKSCVGCKVYEQHRENCFYYWESKRDCTMHSDKQ